MGARNALHGIGDSLQARHSGEFDGDDIDWDAYRTLVRSPRR